jgi:hypothetical protein
MGRRRKSFTDNLLNLFDEIDIDNPIKGTLTVEELIVGMQEHGYSERECREIFKVTEENYQDDLDRSALLSQYVPSVVCVRERERERERG